MKKSVLELTEKDVIHAETHQQSIELCKLFDSLGLKIHDGKSYLTQDLWVHYKVLTCYCPKTGDYCDFFFYAGEGYTIHKATDFISIPGELIGVEIKDFEKQEIDLEILKIYLRAKLVIAEKNKDSDTANEIINQLLKYDLV